MFSQKLSAKFIPKRLPCSFLVSQAFFIVLFHYHQLTRASKAQHFSKFSWGRWTNSPIYVSSVMIFLTSFISLIIPPPTPLLLRARISLYSTSWPNLSLYLGVWLARQQRWSLSLSSPAGGRPGAMGLEAWRPLLWQGWSVGFLREMEGWERLAEGLSRALGHRSIAVRWQEESSPLVTCCWVKNCFLEY